jgi:hypothetical protein
LFTLFNKLESYLQTYEAIHAALSNDANWKRIDYKVPEIDRSIGKETQERMKKQVISKVHIYMFKKRKSVWYFKTL